MQEQQVRPNSEVNRTSSRGRFLNGRYYRPGEPLPIAENKPVISQSASLLTAPTQPASTNNLGSTVQVLPAPAEPAPFTDQQNLTATQSSATHPRAHQPVEQTPTKTPEISPWDPGAGGTWERLRTVGSGAAVKAVPILQQAGRNVTPLAQRTWKGLQGSPIAIVLVGVVTVALGVSLVVSSFNRQNIQQTAPAAGQAENSPANATTAEEPNVVFQAPSKNITCRVNAEAARCDISAKAWEAPEKPENCDGAWGSTLTVGAAEAGLLCVKDGALQGGSTLDYGNSVIRGPIKCQSTKDGMRCENATTGRGFIIARHHQETF